MSGMKGILMTVGKVLLVTFFLTGLIACGDVASLETGQLEPTKKSTPEKTPTIELSPTSISTNTPEIVTKVEIAVGAANLRSGPGTDSTIVGAVNADEDLELVEESSDGQWYKVETESGVIGWIGSSVATVVETEVTQDPEVSEGEETPAITIEDRNIEVPDLGGETALVTYVADGDTIVVEIDGVEERVRYIGINAPELDEACGPEASRANRLLVDGQEVILVNDVSDRDGFKRLLRHVYVGDVLISEELVKQGWAFPISYAPDTAMDDVLAEARDGAPRHDCQLPAAAEPTEEPPATAQPPAPAAPAPADPPQPQPAPTEPPAPAGPPAGGPGFCTCTGPDLNCPAFATHNEAQACHDHCMGLGYGDIYGLDGHNNNGLACESLP